MIFAIISDEQLLASIIVESVIVAACTGGVIINVYKLFFVKKKERNKYVRIFLAFIFLITILLMSSVLKKDFYMYTSYTIVEGEITGFCTTTKNEDGVAFSYTFKNRKYSNCNVFFPFPKDSIHFNKKYKIRINIDQPEDGRILLNQ